MQGKLLDCYIHFRRAPGTMGGPMWEYTDKVREHFLNPRNAGSIDGANAVGEVGSLACGDALKLYLRIEDNVIQDAGFETFGCASAIASSSALTEMVKGKTVEEALRITNKDIAAFLDGLPKEKMHCSVMGQEALEAAIRQWRGEAPLPHTHEGRLVCKCFGVTDEQIKKAIRENVLSSVDDVTYYTKAGGGCGECIDDIAEILRETLAEMEQERNRPLEHGQYDTATAPATAPGGIADFRTPQAAEGPQLNNIQRMQKVMQVLEQVIKPRLNQDGGDIELVDINGKVVSIALKGMCASCPSSRVTVDGFVQQTLREQVESDIIVKETSA